ncbi:pyocin knob domain-containing protein [Vibrio parahaemolyticus]|uniref:pyocin knob domain-containing protein n=1 Tax=Vibrio parahaemolyticus TaxID=670 RepID=UPI0024919B2D|nr:pyocin knob domain-containing protein [Vibrio parahaemolyticus]
MALNKLTQVGGSPARKIREEIATKVDEHASKKTNPHGVTKAQVGLGNVPNYPATSSVSDTSNSKLATAGAVKQAYDKGVEGLNRGNAAYDRAEQAETNANKHTDNRISALIGGAPAEALDTIKELGDALMDQGDAVAAITTNIAQHKSDTSNPHKVTKAQVGLSNVPNYAFTAAVNDASDVKFAAAGAVKKAYDLAASKMTQAQADGRYLKLAGGTMTGILNVGSSKFLMDGVNMMGASASTTRFGDATYARPMSLNAKDGVINVIVANGAAAKRVFHEGYKPKLSDLDTTVIDLDGLDATKFYAVVLEPTSSNSVGALFHVDISTKSTGGSDPYNNNTVTGFVRGGGWSDLHAAYELTCVKYADNETTIHSVWEGDENFTGVVFYVRGNQHAVIRTNANVKAIRSGTYTNGSSVFGTGVSDPNSAVTKGSKLVQFDKGGFYKSTSPNRTGVLSRSLSIEGEVDFNNYTLTGSYNVYGVSSASNRPPNADYGTLDVIGRENESKSFVTQIFTRKADGSQYIRTRNDGGLAWTPWKKIYSEALKPTASDVGLPSLSFTSGKGTTFTDSGKKAWIGARNTSWVHLETDATSGFYSYSLFEFAKGINVHSDVGIKVAGKEAIKGDTWLRLNPSGHFSAGVYFGNVGVVRTDGYFTVGDWNNQSKTTKVNKDFYDSSWGGNGVAAYNLRCSDSSGAHWALASYYDATNIRAGIQILSNSDGRMRFYTNRKSNYVEVYGGNVYAGSAQSSAGHSLARKDYVDSKVAALNRCGEVVVGNNGNRAAAGTLSLSSVNWAYKDWTGKYQDPFNLVDLVSAADGFKVKVAGYYELEWTAMRRSHGSDSVCKAAISKGKSTILALTQGLSNDYDCTPVNVRWVGKLNAGDTLQFLDWGASTSIEGSHFAIRYIKP